MELFLFKLFLTTFPTKMLLVMGLVTVLFGLVISFTKCLTGLNKFLMGISVLLLLIVLMCTVNFSESFPVAEILLRNEKQNGDMFQSKFILTYKDDKFFALNKLNKNFDGKKYFELDDGSIQKYEESKFILVEGEIPKEKMFVNENLSSESKVLKENFMNKNKKEIKFLARLIKVYHKGAEVYLTEDYYLIQDENKIRFVEKTDFEKEYFKKNLY